MRLFKVENLPLTEKQIDICDFILKNKNIGHPYNKLFELKYEESDIRISSAFMIEHKLLIHFNPVVLTVLGSRYINRSIIRFIIIKRINDFVNMPILKFGILLTGIFISLVFNTINYIHADKIDTKSVHYNDAYQYVDSVLSKQNKELYNLTISDSLNKITFDSVFNIIELHNNRVIKE